MEGGREEAQGTKILMLLNLYHEKGEIWSFYINEKDFKTTGGKHKSHTSDKGLITKKYKELKEFNSKTNNMII